MTAPNKVPTAPGAFPGLGHTIPLLYNPLKFLRSLPTHGDLVRIHIGPVAVLVVCDPILTSSVLRNDRVFDKGGFFWDKIRDTIGDGISSCPYKHHRRQRRLISPVLRVGRMSNYGQIMAREISETCNSWNSGTEIEIFRDIQHTACKVLMLSLFSDRLPSPVLHELSGDFGILMPGLFWRMILPSAVRRIPTPGNIRYRRAGVRFDITCAEIIAQRRASVIRYDDLLDTLLSTRDTEGEGSMLSDAEINATVKNFLLAGTETAAATISGSLFHVSQFPDVEASLHAEVDAVLGGRPATYEDVPNLALTTRIVTETLRLWSPVYMLTRVTATDTTLGEYDIPAGASILISPHILHHRADLFPDPERFAPDRWLQSDPSHRQGMIPFGGGARKCIGDEFGMTEAVIALATIASRWQLRPVNNRFHPRPRTTLASDRLRMKVHARSVKP